MLSDDFLDTATRLAAGATEGDWRSAVSRGYYAVFHSLHASLLANGLDLGQGGQVHYNLYAGLHNCGLPPVQQIARRLDRLREQRGWADYDRRRIFTPQNAQDAVREAGSLVADFQAVLTAVPAASVAAGARAHLQRIGRLPRTP